MNEQQPDVAESLTKAWDRMNEMMFQTFEWKNWLIIGFIAFMMNCGRGISNAGFNTNSFNGNTGPGGSPFSSSDLWMIFSIVVIVVILGIIFSIAASYFGSHAEFSLIKRVANADIDSGPLLFDSSYAHLANSLFLLKFLILVLPTIVLLIVGAIGAFLIFPDGNFDFERIPVIVWIIGGILVILLFVVSLLLGFLINNYAIPLMYMRDIKAFPALGQGFSLFFSNFAAGIFFMFMRFVLAILYGIISFVAAIPLCCICVGFIPVLNALLVSAMIAPIHVLMTSFTLYFIESHFAPGTIMKQPMNFGGGGNGGGSYGMAAGMSPYGGPPPASDLRSQVYVQPTFEEYEAQQKASQVYPPPPQASSEPYNVQRDYSPYERQSHSEVPQQEYPSYPPPPPLPNEPAPYGGGGDDRYAVDSGDSAVDEDSGHYPPPPPPPSDYHPEELAAEEQLPPPLPPEPPKRDEKKGTDWNNYPPPPPPPAN